MLTAASILDAARTRGIFAVPMMAGEIGPVLLASVCDPDRDREQLLALNALCQIKLVEVPVLRAWRSQDERGFDPSILGRSYVSGAEFAETYHAVLVEAAPTTGDDLTEEEIESVRAAHPTSNPIAAWCTEALTGDPFSRARIAAAINHRRGILP